MGEFMPIYDFALLALLASGGHRLDGFTLTLGPDALVQPNGGSRMALLVKDEGKAGTNIKFAEIKGEAQDHKHKDTIQIESNKSQLKNGPPKPSQSPSHMRGK
jgi:hypothetical protein